MMDGGVMAQVRASTVQQAVWWRNGRIVKSLLRPKPKEK